MYIAGIERSIIIDTDAGGDPDDTLAIIQACKLDNVAAFVTSDETLYGARARFVQRLVHEAGADIPVYTGLPSPNPGSHLLDMLASGAFPPLPLMAEGLGPLLQHPENIHWVGIGSFTNLAWVGKNFNAHSMRVTAMGGRLDTDPTMRLEHNVKVDPDSAMAATELFDDITFLPSTVTMSEAMAVSSTHPALAILRAEGAMAALSNFDQWFENKYEKSYQHDLATLAFACGAARGAVKRVRMNREGRFTDDESSNVRVVYGGFEYEKVWQWFYSSHPINNA